VVAAVWVVVAVVLQLWRNRVAPAFDVVWAEDGDVFLDDALSSAPGATLFEPYAGYLHVLPRILGELVSVFPVEYAAVLLAGTAALVVALLSVYVYAAARPLVPSPTARAALAGLFVLLPAAGFETNASVANLHWYLLFATALAFVAVPTSRRAVVAGVVVAALCALSDPLAALLLPLLLLRGVRQPARAWWAPGVVVVGLALQFTAVVVSYEPNVYGEVVPGDIPHVYGLRVAGSFLVGDRHLDSVAGLGGAWPAYVCLLLVTVLVAWLAVASAPRTRRWVIVFAGYSVLFLVVTVGLRGTEEFFPGVFTFSGSRYTVVPLLFLYAAVLAALGSPWPSRDAERRRVPLLHAFLLLTGALVLMNYGGSVSVRDEGPGWRDTVDVARQLCAEADGEPVALPGQVLGEPGEVTIPVAPEVEPPHPARVFVPCDRLQ
jgi:hypothetical protein